MEEKETRASDKNLQEEDRQEQPKEYYEKVLTDNGLEEYIDCFKKQKLTTPEVLSELTDQDLQNIGVSILGDRKKILLLFNKKQSESSKEQSKPEPTVIQVSNSDTPKKSGGVWVVVGVLIIIVLVIIIIGSL